MRSILGENRSRGGELSSEARATIIASIDAKISPTKVAEQIGCSRRTVYNTISRWRDQHNNESRPRVGRPKVLNRREKRTLLRLLRTRPRASYEDICAYAGVKIHRSTLYRLAKANHIIRSRAKK